MVAIRVRPTLIGAESARLSTRHDDPHTWLRPKWKMAYAVRRRWGTWVQLRSSTHSQFAGHLSVHSSKTSPSDSQGICTAHWWVVLGVSLPTYNVLLLGECHGNEVFKRGGGRRRISDTLDYVLTILAI